MRLRGVVQHFPGVLGEEAAGGGGRVVHDDRADLFRHELRPALGAAAVVQLAQRLLFVRPEPSLLLHGQGADALRVLAHEVLVLERRRLLDGHPYLTSPSLLASVIASIALFARSYCGESLSVCCSSLVASASWRKAR